MERPLARPRSSAPRRRPVRYVAISLSVFLFLGGALAAAGLAGVQRTLSRISTEPVSVSQSANLLLSVASSVLVVLGHAQALAPTPAAEPVAVLIMGGRTAYPRQAEEVVILSADPASGRVALVTLPAAISFSFSHDAAGLDAAQAAAEALSGIALRGAISLDTEAFVDVVNAFGGLELGTHRLDGAAALRYLEEPATRLENGRALLSAFAARLSSNPVAAGLSLVQAVDAAGTGLRTNLSASGLHALVTLSARLEWASLATHDLNAVGGPGVVRATFAGLFE